MADSSRPMFQSENGLDLKPLVLTFDDGTSETVLVESEFCQKLEEQDDEEFARSIAESYRSTYHSTNSETLVKKENATTVCASQPSPKSKGTTYWKHEAVLYLIHLYGEHKDKFSSPSYTHQDVWELISEQMKSKGYNLGGIQCDHKFRYLQHRYKVTAEAIDTSVPYKGSWDYFPLMHKLMAVETPAVDEIVAVVKANQEEASIVQHRYTAFPKGMVWEHDAVLILVSLYGVYRDKFHNPYFHKQDVWEKIAEKMRDMGYGFCGIQCSKKFKSMKYRHKINSDNFKSYNERPKWTYYSLMDEVLSGTTALLPNHFVDPDTGSVTIVSKQIPPGETTGDTSWQDEEILLLLSLYKEHHEKFYTCKRKKEVWKMIGDEMTAAGYSYDGSICDSKFRSMKVSFRKIANAGQSNSTWPFYPHMKELMDMDAAVEACVKASMGKRKRSDGQGTSKFKCRKPQTKEVLWKREAVIQLISLYKENRDKFTTASKFKDVWEEISDRLKDMGHYYAPAVCDTKIRVLKHRYKVLSSSKEETTSWPFYNYMQDLIVGSSDVQPVPKRIVPKRNNGAAAKKLKTRVTQPRYGNRAKVLKKKTRPRDAPRGVIWKHEAVLLFISLYREYNERFSSASSQKRFHMWELISKELKARGYNLDSVHCFAKFRSLKYRYKTIISCNDSHRQLSWPYFSEMHDILAGTVDRRKAATSTQESQDNEIVTILEDSSLTSFDPVTMESGYNLPTHLLQSRSPSPSYVPLTPPSCSEPLTPQPSGSPIVTQNSTPRNTQVKAGGSSKKRKINETAKSSPRTSKIRKLFIMPSKDKSGGSSKGGKDNDNDPPEWVKTFVETSTQRFDKLEEAANKLIVVEERRNELLEELINHLKNKT